MSFLVVSNILLWAAVIGLGIVNYALLRQVGVLYERVAPAGALMVNRTLEVGAQAPALEALTLTEDRISIGGGAGSKSQLLFFMSPDCPVCNELMPALLSSARAEAAWVDVVLVSDGDQQDHAGYVARKGIPLPYVVSELVGKSYGVSKLPYAVLVDEQQRVASLGIVNSREHIDSLFEAKEQGVASIQDFMNKRTDASYVEVKS